MKIRECEKADLDEILKIEEASFEYPYSRSTFVRYLTEDFILVSENEKGRLTGYIIGKRRGKNGFIVSIAVDPTHRRQGIGSSLMKEIQREIDTKRIWLIVRISNVRARSFYSELGYIKVDVIKDYYQDDENGLLMINK